MGETKYPRCRNGVLFERVLHALRADRTPCAFLCAQWASTQQHFGSLGILSFFLGHASARVLCDVVGVIRVSCVLSSSASGSWCHRVRPADVPWYAYLRLRQMVTPPSTRSSRDFCVVSRCDRPTFSGRWRVGRARCWRQTKPRKPDLPFWTCWEMIKKEEWLCERVSNTHLTITHPWKNCLQRRGRNAAPLVMTTSAS